MQAPQRGQDTADNLSEPVDFYGRFPFTRRNGLWNVSQKQVYASAFVLLPAKLLSKDVGKVAL